MGYRKHVGPCARCGRELVVKARGLCKSCYAHLTPAERRTYPANYNSGGCEVNDAIKNMTDAELDAMIAAQRENLPKWWRADEGASKKAIARFCRWRVPLVNLRGGRVMRKGFPGH